MSGSKYRKSVSVATHGQSTGTQERPNQLSSSNIGVAVWALMNELSAQQLGMADYTKYCFPEERARQLAREWLTDWRGADVAEANLDEVVSLLRVEAEKDAKKMAGALREQEILAAPLGWHFDDESGSADSDPFDLDDDLDGVV